MIHYVIDPAVGPRLAACSMQRWLPPPISAQRPPIAASLRNRHYPPSAAVGERRVGVGSTLWYQVHRRFIIFHYLPRAPLGHRLHQSQRAAPPSHDGATAASLRNPHYPPSAAVGERASRGSRKQPSNPPSFKAAKLRCSPRGPPSRPPNPPTPGIPRFPQNCHLPRRV